MTSDSCRPCSHKDAKWAWHTGRMGLSPLSLAWDGSKCVQNRTQDNSKNASPGVLYHSLQHLPGTSLQLLSTHSVLALGFMSGVPCLPQFVSTRWEPMDNVRLIVPSKQDAGLPIRLTSNLVLADSWSRQRDAGTTAMRPGKAKRRLLSASPSERKV